MLITTTLLAWATLGASTAEPAGGHDLRRFERSYWLHASLGDRLAKRYWGPDFPAATAPTREEVANAARLLCGHYGATRLYLMYHLEIAEADFAEVLRWWREACPREVDIVPTFVTRMYDKETSLVFSLEELRRLARTCRRDLGCTHAAIYDVMPDRDHREAIAILSEEFKGHLVRVGIQPDEKIGPEFAWVVQDTWSAFCHGRSDADWRSPGFGAETLRKWVSARNDAPRPVVYDLIVVAWDYQPTQRGEFPGYDDATKNMPLPRGRNLAALEEILRAARPGKLAGLSSDLFILEANSKPKEHDGADGAFYRTLRCGEIYRGYYAEPLEEIVEIYRAVKAGRLPRPQTAPAAQSRPAADASKPAG